MHFALVPVTDSAAAEAELNRFLAQHRVLSVEHHLVSQHGTSAWAVCVSYTEHEPAKAPPGKRSKVDYKEVLDPEHFRLFAGLRELRKELALRDGVAPYVVMTNQQLAAVVRLDAPSREAVATIRGVGAARIDKYADALLTRLAALRGVDATP